MSEAVASSRAITGGLCPECGMAIGVGNKIYKYPGRGGSTTFGNGPGQWICGWCHQKRVTPGAEVRLWECSGCSQMSNPVVMVENRVLCFACYQARSVEAGRVL